MKTAGYLALGLFLLLIPLLPGRRHKMRTIPHEVRRLTMNHGDNS